MPERTGCEWAEKDGSSKNDSAVEKTCACVIHGSFRGMGAFYFEIEET